MANQRELRLQDLVARHLNTHAFDPRVTALSEMQMYVLLELRHPVDLKELESEALQKENEDNDAKDMYHLGEHQEREETPDDVLDLALYAQS